MNLIAGLLELWLPAGCLELPDAGPAHAAKPGQIGLNRQLFVWVKLRS